MGVDHGGELGPRPLPVTRPSTPQPEVGADAACLEPRRVHGGDRGGVDQAVPAGAPDHHGLSFAEGPLASASARMRREAWASVE
jgi:hypothetical protein